MAVNSSSSNDSILQSHLPMGMDCFSTRPSSFIFTAFYITNILLLLPLCILVLYLGLQRSTSAAAATSQWSHSDSFTYHRERGIRIRNISIGCVWLLSSGATGLISLDDVSNIVDFSLLIVSLLVISFCSLSVLCVLIHPGPGEQGGDRERVDQSKQRAFYTIMAILVVLLLRCFASIVWAVLDVSNVDCVMSITEIWLNLPSSLVLPLLFLHRAGTLACRKNNT